MCGSRRREYTERTVRDRSMRASDADRERTADTLREQAGEGRLEPDELEERLEAAYSAKTLADLDGLVADLPVTQTRNRPQEHSWPFSPAFAIIATVIAVSLLAGHAILWPLFLLFFVWKAPFFAPRWR
jgi:hypothetical protein